MKHFTGDTFSALRHRDYRYWWLGQSVSLIGHSMQTAALAWVVYTLTGSAALLGTLAVFRLGPLIFLAVPAGALVDRVPKRKVLIVTQSVLLLQTLALSH